MQIASKDRYPLGVLKHAVQAHHALYGFDTSAGHGFCDVDDAFEAWLAVQEHMSSASGLGLQDVADRKGIKRTA